MPQTIQLSDDSIVKAIRPDLERAKAWQENLRSQREQYTRLYAMSKDAEGIRHLNKDGFSQVVAPLIYESVEGMKVGLDQLFTSPDFFAVTMGENADAGERIRKLLRWNIFEAQYGARQIRYWLDGCLKYHYGVLKVFWDEEYQELSQEFDTLDQGQAAQWVNQGWKLAKAQEIVAEVPVTDALGLPVLGPDGEAMTRLELVGLSGVKMVRQKPVFIGPRLLAVDPEQFFYSPDSPDLDRCRVVAQRVPKRLEDIQRGENTGLYRKGSVKRVAEKLADQKHSEALEDDGYRYDVSDLPRPDTGSERDVMDTSLAALKPGQPVELWEIYTALDIDKDGLLEPVIIHMAHDVLLSVRENPYRSPPFRVARAIESPWKFEGVPYPQSLEQLQIELTQQTRLWNDAAADSVYGNLLTDDEQLANDWVNRGVGAVLMASTPAMTQKKYEIVRPAPPDPSILKAGEVLEGRAERISGVTRYNQGIDANSLNKTATGINIIASLAQQRQKYMASVIAETWKDVLEDMVECFRLFGEPYISYFVAKGNTINTHDYANDFTIQIELGIGPQEKQQQAAVLKEIIQFATSVGVPAGFMSMDHVAKAVDRMGQLLGVPLESYHYTQEEMERMRQQKAMQAQAQRVAEQQSGGQQRGVQQAGGQQAAMQQAFMAQGLG